MDTKTTADQCTVCLAKVGNLGGYCSANLLSCPNKLTANPPKEVGRSVYTTVARRPDAHLRLMIAQSDRALPVEVIQELSQAPEPWVREAIGRRAQQSQSGGTDQKKVSVDR